jgi:hypothetical protein
MRELAKAIEEGRLKPVVIGPYEVDIPGKANSPASTPPQPPGGDILGQILRDLLSGKGGQMQPAGLTQNVGSAVFGERLEPGHSLDQDQFDSLQEVLDKFSSFPRRG